MSPTYRKLLPAKQARIVRLLVERVELSPADADIRLRLEGLASLVRGPDSIGTEGRRAA